ncbi:hypothetical protein CR513_42451, partial [Mucuna pruriens]
MIGRRKAKGNQGGNQQTADSWLHQRIAISHMARKRHHNKKAQWQVANISMHLHDEAKIAFIMDTYQWLMDRIFKDVQA